MTPRFIPLLTGRRRNTRVTGFLILRFFRVLRRTIIVGTRVPGVRAFSVTLFIRRNFSGRRSGLTRVTLLLLTVSPSNPRWRRVVVKLMLFFVITLKTPSLRFRWQKFRHRTFRGFGRVTSFIRRRSLTVSLTRRFPLFRLTSRVVIRLKFIFLFSLLVGESHRGRCSGLLVYNFWRRRLILTPIRLTW